MDQKLFIAAIPLVIINLGLVIWCLVDWAKRKKYRYLNKWMWLVIFLFFQYFGPVFYLILGRDHDHD